VHQFDHPDGQLTTVDVADLVAEIEPLAVNRDLLLVYDTGGITGHPDHVHAAIAAIAAIAVAERLGLPVAAWTLDDSVADTLNNESTRSSSDDQAETSISDSPSSGPGNELPWSAVEVNSPATRYPSGASHSPATTKHSALRRAHTPTHRVERFRSRTHSAAARQMPPHSGHHHGGTAPSSVIWVISRSWQGPTSSPMMTR